VLSVVDNRAYKRILYEVLDHDPTHDDITALLQRLKSALTARDLELQGITTDGSPLYPEPIRTVFGDVAHQICTFHGRRSARAGLPQPRRAIRQPESG
jgi:inosine-uridine nucleoside N-ribohydrolase